MKLVVLYIDKSKKANRPYYEIELEEKNIKKRLKKVGVICKKTFYNYDLYVSSFEDSKIMKMISYMKKEKIDTFVISSNYSLPYYTSYGYDDEQRFLNYFEKRNIKICYYNSIESYFSLDG